MGAKQSHRIFSKENQPEVF